MNFFLNFYTIYNYYLIGIMPTQQPFSSCKTGLSRMCFRYYFSFMFLAFNSLFLYAQKQSEFHVLKATIIDGDTIGVVNLQQVKVVEKRKFKDKIAEKRYRKLEHDVLRAYPFAKAAGNLLRIYSDTLAMINDERKEKIYLKRVENELKKEFGADLMNLSVSQGRILIRLVDRETGDTSYELVKELRGTFSAFFWQTAARIFGHNLKSSYGSESEDKIIEDIVAKIENGDLELPKKK